MSLQLIPMTLREANWFVERHHRHHGPARGCVAVLAACRETDGELGQIVGVAIIGRPSARQLQDGYTAELTRLCVIDGERNTGSFLLGRAWRAAQALGYRRMVTYTLEEEGGASLRAAGMKLVGQAGGGSWSRVGRPRVDNHPLQAKLRWELPA